MEASKDNYSISFRDCLILTKVILLVAVSGALAVTLISLSPVLGGMLFSLVALVKFMQAVGWTSVAEKRAAGEKRAMFCILLFVVQFLVMFWPDSWVCQIVGWTGSWVTLTFLLMVAISRMCQGIVDGAIDIASV
jgi:hypothetical protein